MISTDPDTTVAPISLLNHSAASSQLPKFWQRKEKGGWGTGSVRFAFLPFFFLYMVTCQPDKLRTVAGSALRDTVPTFYSKLVGQATPGTTASAGWGRPKLEELVEACIMPAGAFAFGVLVSGLSVVVSSRTFRERSPTGRLP